MSTQVELSRNEWWEELENKIFYNNNDDKEIRKYLRGAIGAYFSKSNPPSIDLNDYVTVLDAVSSVRIDGVVYYPIYIEGTIRLQSQIETPEDGFCKSNDVYFSDEDDEEEKTVYLVKLKNGMIVKATVDSDSNITSGPIPWVTAEDVTDDEGGEFEQETIRPEDIVGWKKYIE